MPFRGNVPRSLSPLSQYCSSKGLLRWATRECPPPPIKISVPRSGDVALGNAEGGPLTHR
jgi:hypothetical protein